MDSLNVYVEAGTGMALDDTTVAWLFDEPWWGVCGQGADEAEALGALAAAVPGHAFAVAERIAGDEKAFHRDYADATDAERAATLAILDAARAETIALVTSAGAGVLDFDDPARVMPRFATWRTLRQMAWHLTDTESRYYLPSLGLPARPRADDLLTELRASAAYTRRMVEGVDPRLARADAHGEWTTTKLLRRLAWHERSELVTMHAMVSRARTGAAPGGSPPPGPARSSAG